MKYDLLEEPWINVRMKNKEFKSFGILGVIENAAEIYEICDVSMMNEYGVYRFLLAFLMDALRPGFGDLNDIICYGKFDMQVINNYIEECREEGVTFDIFHEKRPFMQFVFDSQSSDSSIKGVCNIDYTSPHGNNHIHFNHTLESDSVKTPAECARCLCSISLFAISGGKGYYPSINGAPPIYLLVKGESLFETLARSLYPSIGSIDYNAPPIYYRYTDILERNNLVPKVSILFGMTFPSRKVQLIPSEDGLVRKVYYGPGFKLDESQEWQDPYVVYCSNDSNPKPRLSTDDMQSWLYLSEIFPFTKSEICSIVNLNSLMETSCGKEKIKVTAYGIKTDKAIIFSCKKSDYCLPISVVKDEEKFQIVNNYIECVKNYLHCLDKKINDFYRTNGMIMLKNGVRTIVKEVRIEYYNNCEKYLFLDLVGSLDLSEEEQLVEVTKDMLDFLRDETLKSYDFSMLKTGLLGKNILKAEKLKTELIGLLEKERRNFERK